MTEQWWTGTCWLWCERDGVLVMWLGEARTEAESAPVYACGPCVERLAAKVQHHAAAQYSLPSSYRRGDLPPS